MRQDDDKIAVLMRMTDVMCICPARLVLVESPALLLHDSFHQHSVFESHCYQRQNECPPSTLSCLALMIHCVMLHATSVPTCAAVFPYSRFCPNLSRFYPNLSRFYPNLSRFYPNLSQVDIYQKWAVDSRY